MSLRAAASRAAPQAAEAQVLLGRELGDHAAALGHVREPAPDDVLDRDAEDLLAVQPHTPAAARSSPEIVRSSEVLPAPFAPSTAVTLPSLDRERDTPSTARTGP